jgi:hypothetical protein
MSNEMDIENATKAVQTADLLLSDLQELNRGGNAVVSLLVLSEIEKVAGVKLRLEAFLDGIKAV